MAGDFKEEVAPPLDGCMHVEICKQSETSAEVIISGSKESIGRVSKLLLSKFNRIGTSVTWIYDSKGNSINVPINTEHLPVEEMYPFLEGESLEAYYDRFKNSSANILLLIGPPGGGKSTFIRGYLEHIKGNALLTYSMKRFLAVILSLQIL